MGTWRYLGQQLTGDGNGVWFPGGDLQITAPEVTDALSAPPVATATIAADLPQLKGADGQPLFQRWKTAIYAEAAGQIRAGWLLRDAKRAGTDWELDLVGFSAYPGEQGYDGEKTFVGEDPFNIYRHIWAYLQSQPGGNLGVEVGGTVSPVRVGTPEQTSEFTTSDGINVSGESGPRELNWWSTTDLGEEIDRLAAETPFDWLETHAWGSGDQVAHRIVTDYPRIGGKRPDLRLVYGENVRTRPEVGAGRYANGVVVLGSGEGRTRVRGYAGTVDGRLRRVRTVEDTNLTSTTEANARARRELAAGQGQYVVDTILVEDHSNADLMAIQLGDSMPYYAKLDGLTLDQWVRVVRRTVNPARPDRALLTVVRSDIEVLV